MRYLIHAGFHKTGTSTVQRLLADNRKNFVRLYQIVLKNDFPNVTNAARNYSVEKTVCALDEFRTQVDAFMTSFEFKPKRLILISAEDLCGLMPGRVGLKEYEMAPVLLQALAKRICHYDTEAEIEFFITKRASHPWVNSCYAQNLRVTRCRLDREDYLERYLPYADHNAIVKHIADAVEPHKVVSAWLEDSSDRALGPLDLILDHLNTLQRVRNRIEPIGIQNHKPSEAIQDKMLMLNRSDISPLALITAKRHLMRGHKDPEFSEGGI